MPMSSDSSLGSSSCSSRASSHPKSPSPASVIDADDHQSDALAVLGDLGIIEDEFDISLLAKLFEEEESASKCIAASPSSASRKSASSMKRSHPAPTSKSKKPRAPP